MIFIDFDDTVYNTKSFKDSYLEIFQRHGVSKEDFDKTYYSKNENSGSEIYDYERHLERLKCSDALKKSVRLFLGDTSEFVFKDFFGFARTFRDERIVLLSYGKQPFQGIKIESSGTSRFFDEIVVTDGNKSPIVQKFISKKGNSGKIFLLDDRTDQLEEVLSSVDGVCAIRVRRDQGRYKNLRASRTDIKNVSDLIQATEYIIKCID